MEQMNNFTTSLTLNNSQKKLIELILRISKKYQVPESPNLHKVHKFATALLNLSESYKAQKNKFSKNKSSLSDLSKICKQADSLRTLLTSLSADQVEKLDKEKRRIFEESFYKNEAFIEEFDDCASPIHPNELIFNLTWLCQASDTLSKKRTKGRSELVVEANIAKEFLFICHRYGQLQITVSNSLSEKKNASARGSESDAVQCLSAIFESGGDSATQATRSARTQLRKLRKGFTYVLEAVEDDGQYYESELYWVDFNKAKDLSPLGSLPNFAPAIGFPKSK